MGIWNDLRRAARTLVREPGFAAACLLTLALGIGANTAIFSIVNGVLLRPLPYQEPQRLVALREILPAVAQVYPSIPVSARHFVEWRQRARSFENLSVITTGNVTLTGAREPEQLDWAHVSANVFDTLGVRPAIGRGFLAGEDEEGRNRVVILTDALWRRRFHADPSILGKTIALDSRAHTVVGVLPAGFWIPDDEAFNSNGNTRVRAELFVPVTFEKDELAELMGMFNYSVIGRLKQGVTREQALAELNVIGAQIAAMAPGEKVELRASAVPLRESVVAKSRRGLLVLAGAVGALLLIVCVNLANLMLARAERRSHEAAIRTALGAGRGRLLGSALTEALLIALLGGALGVAVAGASLGALVRSAPADIPRLSEVRLDSGVLLFALALTTATGLLFGLAPAWRTSRADPQSALKSGGRATTGGSGGARLRGALVAAQVALSAMLLITAALLMTSFLRLLNTDMGFRAPAVLAGRVAIPWAKYSQGDQRDGFFERLLERLAASPGVASAAISNALPLEGETWIDAVWAKGDTGPAASHPAVNVRFVSADFFRTMGIPLLAGRTFNDGDRQRKAALVSERLAERLWPGQNPLGRTFTNGSSTWYEVIGVAHDVRAHADAQPVFMVYRGYWEWPPTRATLAVRAAGDPRSIAGAIHAAIRNVDADVPLPELRTMREVLDLSVAERRFQMLLAAFFAATALLLASLGIYGVVSYTIARRTNEMGVRMALGAQPGDVRGMVLRQGMTPVALGLIVGVGGALAAGRLLASLLYEVSARDPLVIGAVSVLLALVALAACYLPANRAARVDPLAALRYE
jgi:predicted permease